jgi:hypothetical protein
LGNSYVEATIMNWIDVLIGGGITLVVAWVLFWRSERSLQRKIDLLGSMLEWMNEDGSLQLLRDSKGHVRGALKSHHPTVTVQAAVDESGESGSP